MDHRSSLYPWTNPWVESTLNRMKTTNEVEKSIDGDHEGKVEDDESDVKRVSSSQFASGKHFFLDKIVEFVIERMNPVFPILITLFSNHLN